MATPQRPLPGSFMSTPGPVRPSITSQRPPSFRLPSNPSLQRQVVPAQNPQPNSSSSAVSGLGPVNGTMRSLPPFERAAQAINSSMSLEQRFPALDDYILRAFDWTETLKRFCY